MKTIAAVALLTAIGGGAAFAQRAPPSLAPWHSGWSSYIESHQAQARGAIMTQPESRVSLARNGRSMPVTDMASREPAGARAVN